MARELYLPVPGVKEEKHMIISINRKSICQNPIPCYDKNWHKLEGDFVNLIKDMHEKPTVKIRLNGERLNIFTLKSGTRE